MIVEEIMTRNIIAIGPEELVVDACKKCSDNNVGSLVVMNDGMIIGIVTERDIIQSVLLVKEDPKQVKVKEIMTPHIKTIHALDKVEKAARIMKENSIKKLPVILNNEIVGIITETDITRTINAYSEAITELTELYVGSKETIEKIMDDWGDIIIRLKNYKKLSSNKEVEVVNENSL